MSIVGKKIFALFARINTISDKIFRKNTELPSEYLVPYAFDVPIRDQKSENNCTSQAFASMFETKLSARFKERVFIDVDDLWEKQKKFGTANEKGDTFKGIQEVADKYGMLFKTESGIKGIFKPSKGIKLL